MRDLSLGWWSIAGLSILYWIAVLLGWAGWSLYRAKQFAEDMLRANPQYAKYPIGVLSPARFPWPIAIALITIPPIVLIYLEMRAQSSGMVS